MKFLQLSHQMKIVVDLNKNILNFTLYLLYLLFHFPGVFFTSRFEHVKFVDFCGKYRVPLMQYLCSPSCHTTPAFYRSGSDTETDEEVDSEKLRKVLLG